MATVLWGVLVVFVSVLLAIIGQVLVQRLVPLPTRRSSAASEELEESIEGFEPSTNREQATHTQLITLVDDLGNHRQLRLLESRQGVPSILWTVLVIGGILTVAFTFLFGVEPPWFHRVAIAALTVVIVLVLYTFYRIEYPFTGEVRVRPDAFELVLQKISGHSDP